MNKLYFGDNLEILREMDDEQVNLICTDPPFNSGRDYNTFIDNSIAQKKAFTDTWVWDAVSQDTRANIEHRAYTNDTYKALNNSLKGYDFVLQNAVSGSRSEMRAYLAFMGPRLAEMHRVLAKNGSIYLHCDPTASHYLKGVMDAIFGADNFRREIIWNLNTASGYKSQVNSFIRGHDVILYYTKNTDAFVFNKIFQPHKPEYIRRFKKVDEQGRHYRDDRPGKARQYLDQTKGVALTDVWSDIMSFQQNSTSVERLGYPTQKPRILYERMIKASSNKGDIVLDPFCGCGTTIDAAHTLKRRWIGIDITILALDPMRQRLKDRHGLEPSKDYKIEGYPTTMQEVAEFLKEGDKRKYHDFSNWAVTRLGLKPTRDVNDGGLDGIGQVTLWNPQQMKETNARILAEVKTGKPTVTQVRAFCHVMDQNDADIGIFITLESISASMRQEAENMGSFIHNGQHYPRLQFWQIDDAYFENSASINTHIRLPNEWRIRPTQKSERHFAGQQPELLIR